eukprot:SAG31_NODE_5430_length_2543_cov_1.662848_2_plen_145_part_00
MVAARTLSADDAREPFAALSGLACDHLFASPVCCDGATLPTRLLLPDGPRLRVERPLVQDEESRSDASLLVAARLRFESKSCDVAESEETVLADDVSGALLSVSDSVSLRGESVCSALRTPATARTSKFLIVGCCGDYTEPTNL